MPAPPTARPGGVPVPLDAAWQVAPGVCEKALVFECGGQRLVAVLSTPTPGGGHGIGTPPAGVPGLALLIIVGGPQYRVGSHRQFVQLARASAAAGFPSLRFDVRGMGDSEGASRGFESLDDDISAALECLSQQLPTLQGVVLVGLCDGASAALMYGQAARSGPPSRLPVRGLALLNPWVRSPATQSATQVKYYYTQRLREASFWRKLLRGQVAAAALGELWQNLKTMWDGRAAGSRKATAGRPAEAANTGFQDRMAAEWAQPGQRLFLLLCSQDQTAQEFMQTLASSAAWRGALQHPGLTRHDMAQADHTLSTPEHSREFEQQLLLWLRQQVQPQIEPS